MGGSPERAGPQLQSGATGRKLSPQFSPRGLLAGIRVSDRRVLQLCLSITPSRSTLRSFVSTVQPRLLRLGAAHRCIILSELPGSSDRISFFDARIIRTAETSM